jgi:hypothetical protein
MPYQRYDTGWIRSIYSTVCLGWFLLSNGLLPRYTIYSLYNNFWNPFTTALIALCESAGAVCIYASTKFTECESIIFKHIDYISPMYSMIQCIQSLIPTVNVGRPPSFNCAPSNLRRRKTSTGRHLGSYFARKRRLRSKQVITDYLIHPIQNEPIHRDAMRSHFEPVSNGTCHHTFHPINDPSCHDNTWYDAISPYWTGGMVWGGAYVLNHQVVSVSTDPIFVSSLLPLNE